ncbi:MAG: ABC-type Na+ efflux pump, permease component [Planctomycetota bacterium]|nr:ABC-type Na+ efflux pump, permease component [Planctomycetota bacterium]
MRWSNVRTIFSREVRDQLRDRRTLFMILVLPILLYPILGIGMASLATAFEQKPRTVILVGAEFLPDDPPLLNEAKNGFRVELFDPPTPEEARRLNVIVARANSSWADEKQRASALRQGLADAVVLVPPDIRDRLKGSTPSKLPVAFNSADEQSQVCALRVRDVIAGWQEAIVQGRLKRDHKPASYVKPVQFDRVDVARVEEVGGNVWARLFPFLLVMMALTGAFYPAIDLCAGEKERGTMETLLISPASRVEIVMGKFFTVMVASIATALLNIASMGLTGWQLAKQFGGMGAGATSGRRLDAALAVPSLTSAAWMIVLLIPLAMLFSAVCLALAVLARSMKEGQYYMTPLYLVAMPLMFLTLAPGIELNLFTSLVPITGVSLLLRTLMQGKYDLAARFSLPVLLPTIVYGVLALRWAVDQFQSETVLFREAERFDVKDYLRHLVRDRGPLPGPGQAILCFAVMLTSAWFVAPYLGTSPASLAIGQAAFILGPPVVFAILLTSNPLRTLLLVRPRWLDLALATVLALALNPLVSELRPVVETLFPVPDVVKTALSKVLIQIPNLGVALLLLAAVPAFCEEVAFRGFILSGLRSRYRVWSAILLSAFLFGFLHVLLSLFQQLFNATLLGLVLGLLAVKTRSLWPGVVFHAVNNGLAVLLGTLLERPEFAGLARGLYRDSKTAQYQYAWIILGALVSVWLIATLLTRPDSKEATEGEP